MSGETESDVSGWTVDTLRVHIDTQLDDLKRLLDERYVSQQREVLAALTSAEKAVTKAETAAEKRFESVNEFRGQLSDQANTFMPRPEGDIRINAVSEKIDVNAARISDIELRLSSRLDIDQGKTVGINATVVYVLAGLGALGTVVSILINFIK